MRLVKNTSSRGMKTAAWIFMVLLIGAIGYLIYEALSIQIFSMDQLLTGGVILAALCALLGWTMFSGRPRKGWRIFAMVMSVVLGAGACTGGYYLAQTSEFFAAIANPDKENGGTDNEQTNAILNDASALSEKMAMTVTTYTLKTTGMTKPTDLSGKVVGVMSAMDGKGTQGAKDQLTKGGLANPEYREYENAYGLVDALYNGEVDAIVLPEQYHGDLLEVANDDNKYNALTTFSNTIDQYIYYEPVPEEMKNPADEVKDITKDPFTVLISGSDSYGTLAVKSRSDVNMLAVVNPKTSQVLLVSVPRDAYMAFSCKKNETACGYAAGQMDKLTHSGIYGIGTTESSLEDFLEVDINYTVRVNFSSLINVVDAIGGIDVEVEPGLEVERFYANGTEGVKAGMNHLEGERALAFARERYAYIDGDNQRVRNQQIVMKALLKAMMSPSMIIKYPAFIRALSTAFSTNMPASQIRDLIRLEVSSFPNWNIQSFALSGNDAIRFCAALNNNAAVSLINENDLEQARNLIDDVIAGKTIDVPKPQTKKDSSAPSSSQSSAASYDDSGYDTMPIDQLPGYNPPAAPQAPEVYEEIPVDIPYTPTSESNQSQNSSKQ